MANSNVTPQVNWTQGTSLVSNEMSFEEKLNAVIRKAYRLAKAEEMNEGDLLFIGGLSDWTNQTFHQLIEDIDGLYVTRDLKKISRLATCENYKSNHKKFKRPIRLVNAQTVVFKDNTFIPLYEENRDWLTSENAYMAMWKVYGRRYGSYSRPECAKIQIHSGMYPIEHIAFVYRRSSEKNLYCLLDSGFIFEATSEEVSETPIEIGYMREERFCSSDFVQYKNIAQNIKDIRFIEK